MRHNPLLLTCTVAATVIGANILAVSALIQQPVAEDATSDTTTRAMAIAEEMMKANPTAPVADSANGKYNVAVATNGSAKEMTLSGRGALTALLNNAVTACRAEKPTSQAVFENCVTTQFMQPALFRAYSTSQQGLSFNTLLPNASLPFKD